MTSEPTIHRDPFEQPERDPIIPIEEANEYAQDTAKAASAIKVMTGSAGWRIFLTLISNKRDEIKEKDDYQTIEAFRSDRTAINILEDIIGELDNLVGDADAAADLFTKLNGADGQTPRSSVSLATGGDAVEG